MDKCIGYLVRKDDFSSISEQRESILAYAKENDYELVDFIEEQPDGKNEKWWSIIHGKDIDALDVSAIIMANNLLLSSDTRMFFYYTFLLYKKGIDLIAVEENLGVDSSAANRFRTILMFMAEREKNALHTRTSKSRQTKAKSGGYSGGRPPFGYKVENGNLVINEDEAKTVEEIFRLRKFEVSYQGIARYLNSNGIKTRTGKNFNQSKILAIVGNKKLYQGFYRYGDSGWVKGVHNPILGEDD